MAFLTPDSVRVEYGLEIKTKILPADKKPNRLLSYGTGKVEHITVHNTDDINEAQGTTDAEQYVRATFSGNMGGVTVHYFIDDDACWQELNENEVGYHAADGYSGPGNNTSIAIEIIMSGRGQEKDKKAEDRGALLAAILLKKHGLGIDRLTTHNRWYSPKYCPAYILPHWDEFKDKVEYYLDKINNEDKPEPEKPAEGVLYKVQTGAFKVKENAEKYSKDLAEAGFDNFITEDSSYYKVQVGAYRNKDNAVAYRDQIRAEGFESIIIEVRDKEPEKYTAADARLALRAATGLEELSPEDLKHLDIDGDGKVTSSDSREIMRRATGLE